MFKTGLKISLVAGFRALVLHAQPGLSAQGNVLNLKNSGHQSHKYCTNQVFCHWEIRLWNDTNKYNHPSQGQHNQEIYRWILKEEALKALLKFKEDDSMVCNGWLDSFSSQHKVKMAKLHGECVDICLEVSQAMEEAVADNLWRLHPEDHLQLW